MSFPTLNPKETAVVIRKILRNAFPSTKFRVRIGRGAGVSSVDIHWTDGPSTRRVDALVHGFSAGHFDGMQDMYEYDNSKRLLVEGVAYEPGTRYIFASRDKSPRFVWRAAQAVMDYRWAMEPGEELELQAAVDTLGANLTPAGVRDFYNTSAVFTVYPGHGNYAFRDLVHQAMSDRTTVLHSHTS